MNHDNPFNCWALITDSNGVPHSGHASEFSIGGIPCIKLKVPETDSIDSFERIFFEQDMKRLDPIDEMLAIALANKYQRMPIDVYSLPKEWVDKINNFGDEPDPSSGEDVDDPW